MTYTEINRKKMYIQLMISSFVTVMFLQKINKHTMCLYWCDHSITSRSEFLVPHHVPSPRSQTLPDSNCQSKPKAIKIFIFDETEMCASASWFHGLEAETQQISVRSCFSWHVTHLDGQRYWCLDTGAFRKCSHHNWHIFGHVRSQVHEFSHTHTNEKHSMYKAFCQYAAINCSAEDSWKCSCGKQYRVTMPARRACQNLNALCYSNTLRCQCHIRWARPLVLSFSGSNVPRSPAVLCQTAFQCLFQAT